MSTTNRYLVIMEFYEWGENEREALSYAEHKARDMRDNFDNDASITKLYRAPFGRSPKEIRELGDIKEQNENKD